MKGKKEEVAKLRKIYFAKRRRARVDFRAVVAPARKAFLDLVEKARKDYKKEVQPALEAYRKARKEAYR